MLRLGFLASHHGSNMQAVVDACRAGRIRALPAMLAPRTLPVESGDTPETLAA